MNPIRAAVVQFNHHPGDVERNWEIVELFISEAQQAGVDLLVFPEMCLSGYWHVRNLSRAEVEELSEPVPEGPSCQRLVQHAKNSGMTIGVGLIEKGADGKLYNSYAVAMSDGRIECHRKLHCFISEHMDSGDEYTVFDTPQGVRVGVLICYDNNIGENVRINALRGAEVLLAPHQTGGCHSPSPKCMGRIDPEIWLQRESDPKRIEDELKGSKGRAWLMKWLPARAHDNGLFLLFANGVGIDDDEVRTGNAMILDPYGDVLAETWEAADKMVVADLDPQLRDMCTGQRWLRTRRPELFGDITKVTGQEEDTRKVRFGFKE